MWKRELEVAITLAKSAATVILEIQRRGFAVEDKSFDNPVTEADKAGNAHLVAGIAEAFPDDVIAAEESINDVDLNADRVWFIDPIDGTKDFIKGNGEWSIMIGFTFKGRPVMGVVYQPEIDAMYVGAAGEGAWRTIGNHRAKLRAALDPEPTHATIVGSRSHPDARILDIEMRLGIVEKYVHGSVGCKLAQISERRADLYFNLACRCHMWDTCAPEAILEAAGGRLVDLDGEVLHYGGDTTLVSVPFFATTKALLPQVQATLEDMDKGALRG